MKLIRLQSLLATSLLTLPFAFALTVPAFDTTGLAQAMGTMWNLIGSMFSFQFVDSNPWVQQGILKFLIFILILRIVQVVVMKYVAAFNDKKTATIIGIVVAAITVIFTPNTFIFTGLIAAVWPIAIAAWLIYFTMSGKRDGQEKDRLDHGLDLLLLFLGILFIGMIDGIYRKTPLFEPEYMRPFVVDTVNILLLVLWMLLFFKLLQFLIGGKDLGSLAGNVGNWFKRDRTPGAGGGRGDAGKGGGDEDDTGKTTRPKPNTLPLPNAPQNFKSYDNPETGNIDLSWDARPPEEQVTHHTIQRRQLGAPQTTGKIRNFFFKNIGGGWDTIGQTSDTTFLDTKNPTRKWYNPRRYTDWYNSKYNPSVEYQYRVAANNASGRGIWSIPTHLPPNFPALKKKLAESENPPPKDTHGETYLGEEFSNELNELTKRMLDLQNAISSSIELAITISHVAVNSYEELMTHVTDLRGRGNEQIAENGMTVQQIIANYHASIVNAQQKADAVFPAIRAILEHPRYENISAPSFDDLMHKISELRMRTVHLEELQNIDAGVVL